MAIDIDLFLSAVVKHLPSRDYLIELITQSVLSKHISREPEWGVRFTKLCDELDKLINGTVTWKGEKVANPWGKKVGYAAIAHCVLYIVTQIDAVSTLMRKGTQYDPAVLPPRV